MESSKIKVEYIHHLGSDMEPAISAWTSSGFIVMPDGTMNVNGKTKTMEDAIRLIKRLGEEHHDACFEHMVMSFNVDVPIFVARHIVRHRLGSFNELSGRYKSMSESTCYVSELVLEEAQAIILENFERCLENYKKLRAMGIKKEDARVVLPLNTMTRIRWTGNLRYFTNFVKLRKTSHAQYETRLVAQVIHDELYKAWPLSTTAMIGRPGVLIA